MNTRQAIQSSNTANVLSVSYSASRKRFVTGLSNGFRSFRTDNCLVTHDPSLEHESAVAIVEALDDRYYAFVLRDKSKYGGPNVVVFWDATLDAEVSRFDLHEPVLGIRLSSSWMAVILEERTVLFQYQELQQGKRSASSENDGHSEQTETEDHEARKAPNLAHSIFPTSTNVHALAALSNDLLALPAPTVGQVQIIMLDARGARTKRVLKAHNSALRCVALSPDASMLATASQQGTLVRVYRTKSTDKVAEFRRGMDHSILYGLAFSPENRFVASTSDKGTLHVFDLLPNDAAPASPAVRERDVEQKKHRRAPSYAHHRLSVGAGFDHDSLSGASAGPSSPAPSTAIGGGPGTGYHGSVQEYYGLRAPPASATPPAREAAVSAVAAIKGMPYMPRAVRDVRSVASMSFYTGNDPAHWQGGLAHSWTTAPNGTRKKVKNPVSPLPSDPSGRPPKGMIAFAPATGEAADSTGATLFVIGGGSDARWEMFELLPDSNTPSGWVLVNQGFRKYLTRQFAD